MADAAMMSLGRTGFILPDTIAWKSPPGAPDKSYENFTFSGDHHEPGPYMTLMRWHPGYMSAPHTYLTDRLALVISGTWWIGDGADYLPDECRAVPAGSFVFRPAGTPHYDGVISGAGEPAVIVVSGLAPLGLRFSDPDAPGLRAA